MNDATGVIGVTLVGLWAARKVTTTAAFFISDRNFGKAEWIARPFFLGDTGGVIEGSDEPLERAVRT